MHTIYTYTIKKFSIKIRIYVTIEELENEDVEGAIAKR